MENKLDDPIQMTPSQDTLFEIIVRDIKSQTLKLIKVFFLQCLLHKIVASANPQLTRKHNETNSKGIFRGKARPRRGKGRKGDFCC